MKVINQHALEIFEVEERGAPNITVDMEKRSKTLHNI